MMKAISILMTAGLAVSLTGCGAGPSGATAPTRTVAQTASGLAAPHGHDIFATLLSSSKDLGPLPSRDAVSLLLLLRNPNAARQAKALKDMYTPGSPSYRKFKTPAQFAAAYGPPPSVAGSVKAWLRQRGLSGQWHRGDSWLDVTGPVRLVERAFRVRVRAYRSPRGILYYASARDPLVPGGLQGEVSGVGRITSYFQPWKHLRTRAVPPNGLTPEGLLKAYNITPLRSAGMDGSGETIAFFEVDGYDQKDLDTFTSQYHLPPIHPEIKAGPALKAGGETEMDLEVAHAIAPRARLLLYNIDWEKATQDTPTFPAYGAKYIVPTQRQMVTDNPHGILSLSWGICDQVWGQAVNTAWRTLYDQADAQGESVFVSTGDSGAYECLNVANADTLPSPDYVTVAMPASLPGVTAVGGTRLSVRQDSSWFDETVWEDPPVVGGTGGGFSAFFQMPSWQKGPGVSSQNNPRGMREIPDVSADADPSSGASIYSEGSWQQGGGTSQAAPIWAGITALMNQYLKSNGLHEAGFLNPALYALFTGKPRYPAFHDVTVGNNLSYSAGPGYDMASGIGTPDAWNLTRDLQAYYRKGAKP